MTLLWIVTCCVVLFLVAAIALAVGYEWGYRESDQNTDFAWKMARQNADEAREKDSAINGLETRLMSKDHTIRAHELAHQELQHAHNSLKETAQIEVCEATEKLKASEELRDELARRIEAHENVERSNAKHIKKIEDENAGLHKLIKQHAEESRRRALIPDKAPEKKKHR